MVESFGVAVMKRVLIAASALFLLVGTVASSAQIIIGCPSCEVSKHQHGDKHEFVTLRPLAAAGRVQAFQSGEATNLEILFCLMLAGGVFIGSIIRSIRSQPARPISDQPALPAANDNEEENPSKVALRHNGSP
jgi:hypothetical protein